MEMIQIAEFNFCEQLSHKESDADCADTCRSKINSKIHNICRTVYLLVPIVSVFQFTIHGMTI